MSRFNLNEFTRTVAANSSAKIAVTGNFLFLSEAGSPMLYRFRDADGNENTITMVKGDSFRADDPFVEVQIVNETASAQEITAISGRGDFDRQPDTAAVFGSIVDSDDHTAGNTTIQANSSRKGVYFYYQPDGNAPTSVDGGFVIRPLGQGAAFNAIQLLPGESIFLETTLELTGFFIGGATGAVDWMEVA